MARLPWTRRATTPVTEAAPAGRPSTDVAPRGFAFGVPVGGTTEYQQGVTTSNSNDRRTQLTELYDAYIACPWSSACVDTIARTVTAGGLEVVWEGEDDTVAPEAPPNVLALRQLLAYVNPTEDIRQLARGIITDLLIFGDAFVEIVWFLGQPLALYSLDVPSMAIIADEHGTVSKYVQVTEFGQRAEFDVNEVIHISLDTPRSGLTGVSPTQKALLPITVWLFTAATLKETMRKGDPVDLHADFPLSESEGDVRKWRAQYAVQNLGPRNIGAPITTRGGATLTNLGQKRVEHYLATLDQKRDEIVSTYGVPPAKVGIIESGNLGGGTGTTQDKTFRVNTCGPLAEIVIEKLVFHLMRQAFGISPEWVLRFGDIDWRDDKTVDDISSARLRDGRWTLNRSRAEIGEPPVEGGDDPVLVDRQNLVLWSDMADMSAAVVAKTGAQPLQPTADVPSVPEPPMPPVDPMVPSKDDGRDEPNETALGARILEQYRARRREALNALTQPLPEAPAVTEATAVAGAGDPLALTEAAEAARTGAYIVLKIADDDASRLAVDGGESAGSLHVTLGFLAKKAAAYTSAEKTSLEERLVSALSTVAMPLTADAFATARFNPTSTDRETCAVLLVQSDELARARDAVVEALGDDLAQTFPVWFPHVAIAYTDDPNVISDGTLGPIVFDRFVMTWGETEHQLLPAPDLPLVDSAPDASGLLELVTTALQAWPAPVVTVDVQPTPVRIDVHPPDTVVEVVPGAPVTIDLPPAPARTRTTVVKNDDGSMTSVTEPDPEP